MSKIIATSDSETLIIEKSGRRICVLLNGKQRNDILPMLDAMVQAKAPYAGSYYPKPGCMIGYLLALQSGAWFANPPQIRTFGRIGSIPACPNAIP